MTPGACKHTGDLHRPPTTFGPNRGNSFTKFMNVKRRNYNLNFTFLSRVRQKLFEPGFQRTTEASRRKTPSFPSVDSAQTAEMFIPDQLTSERVRL